jgi:predicted glycoside hydrolase/deacetylase ChbG (UPF0249 family)
MLIINADDWGGSCAATDNSLICYQNGRITSASSMVFMADSERAADVARAAGLRTGLHLNFTEQFAPTAPVEVRARLGRIAAFLTAGRYRSLVYNPLLGGAFEYVFKAQYDEYIRLYGSEPTHIDGHHHMHLCMNVIVGKVLPAKSRLRGSFTFFPDEKGTVNRLYRQALNAMLRRRHVCPEQFYSVEPIGKWDRLMRIVDQAKTKSVELMVHPARPSELAFLMSDEFAALLRGLQMGTYSDLDARTR